MGLGFTVGLTCIAIVREFIGSGAFFGMEIIPEDFHVTIIGLAPGAFFVLACLTALQNKFKAPSATNGSVPQSTLACGGNCAACSGSACSSNHSVLEEKKAEELKKAEEARKAALQQLWLRSRQQRQLRQQPRLKRKTNRRDRLDERVNFNYCRICSG